MTQLTITGFVLLALVAATFWYWQYRRINIAPLLCKVIIIAAAAGRLAFVLAHLDVYAGAPWRVLDLRDGGLVDVVAMFAAFAMATEGTRRSAALRKPLAVALAGGAAAWALAAILLPLLATAPMQVPATLVRDLDGGAVDLASLRGKPLVINLWASWCPPCRREMPLLEEAQRRHPGVEFVFVNQGEDAAQIARYLRAQRLALRHVFADRLRQVGAATNSIGMPTTLFFNRRGELVGRHVGEIDAASLEAALGPLERRSSPAP